MAEGGAGDAKPGFVPIAVGILEVIKAALWPIAILVIFAYLYSPMKAVMNELPNALGRADVISIGEFKVQMNKALEVSATLEVREALKALPSNQASRLLRLSGIYLVCEFSFDKNRFAEEQSADQGLLSHKLVKIDDASSESKDDRSKCYRVEPTDLGRSTQDFLIKFLSSSLRLGPT
jgi:hypothetical protein